MDDVKAGRFIRTCRVRLGWRQVDLAQRAGVSQQEVSLVERGHIDAVPLRILRSIARPLGASLDLDVRWRGGALDRLIDEVHAFLGSTSADLIRAFDWEVRLEVTYSVYGERGSIDLLAWHASTATLLVAEIKSELTSVEATLRKHDEKVRLARRIARDREQWEARFVSRVLVLPDSSTSRRRLARAASAITAAYPLGNRETRAWLSRPAGAVGGVLLLPFTTRNGAGSRPVSRVRVPRRSSRTPDTSADSKHLRG